MTRPDKDADEATYFNELYRSAMEENSRLRAELDAMKPKPVVWEQEYRMGRGFASEEDDGCRDSNLLVCFHDGVLVSAKVKQSDGSWV